MNEDTFNSLHNDYDVLYLLQVRSKNQHRQKHWFKFMNITCRHLRKIIKLQIDIMRVTSASNGSTILPKILSKLEYKRKQIVDLAQHILKISRQAYYAYNSILVLGQFITLGFALLGNLASIVQLLSKIPGVKKILRKWDVNVVALGKNDVARDIEQRKANTVGNHEEGDDLGEEINFNEEFDDTVYDANFSLPTSNSKVLESVSATTSYGDENSREKLRQNAETRTKLENCLEKTIGKNMDKITNKHSMTESNANKFSAKSGIMQIGDEPIDNKAHAHPTSTQKKSDTVKKKRKASVHNMSINDIFGSSSKKLKKSKSKTEKSVKLKKALT